MKRFFLALAFMVIALSVSAQRQGASSLGFNLGYGFDTDNATLGIDYRYSFTDEVRFAPSLTYYVKNDGLSAWAIDANVHYVVRLSDQFSFYPLGGLSLSFWNYKENLLGLKIDDSATRFGANIGLGGEVYATPELTVGLDLKYHIIKTFDQAMLSVRIAYAFQ